MTKTMVFVPGVLTAVVVCIGIPNTALAYDRWSSCMSCHGDFRASGATTPGGEVLPTSLHDLHRSSAYMATTCGACHTGGSRANPYTYTSDTDSAGNAGGSGCAGCHGTPSSGAAGLRAHHQQAGISCNGCHSDPTPPPEDTLPINYQVGGTNISDPCNLTPGSEDFSGNGIGLDNDGDGLYDAEDPDCGTVCIDNDQDTYSPDGGSCGPVDCNDADPFIHPNAVEVCDNLDNNCDGQVDEALNQTCSTVCGTGVETCQAGTWTGCDAPLPTAETCDGVDNDCNGPVDDGLSRGCSSACGSGTEVCAGGVWGGCDAPLPTAEICDGIDNDCNGQVDDGLSRDCSNACGTGTEVCTGGAWTGCDAPLPTAEICDGIDNDCNGQVDEDLSRDCSNACGAGTELCLGGVWAACDAPVPTPEVCDGVDNNCDGTVDEGCQCQPGQVQGCGSDVGACQQGSQTCQADGTWSACSGEIGPIAEVCNGIDDNCDGSVDEELVRDCSNACGVGSEICVAGIWDGCDAPLPAPEVCDGIDNNCDGSIDEGLTRSCSTACGTGTEACVAGVWSNCDAPQPMPEICDGIDNDCDGIVDAGCQCVAGETQACGSDVGACQPGEQTCLPDGSWDVCTGGVEPVAETCNNIDDDCNGLADDGLTQSCSTACGTGVEVCTSGAWTGCTAPQPEPEICGDSLDNDCNGFVDDGCGCQPGETQPCGSDIGICVPGVQTCLADGAWSSCEGGVGPLPAELCNGQDDNCNGATDEDLTQGCTSACGSGVQTCASGQWGPCSAPTDCGDDDDDDHHHHHGDHHDDDDDGQDDDDHGHDDDADGHDDHADDHGGSHDDGRDGDRSRDEISHR